MSNAIVNRLRSSPGGLDAYGDPVDSETDSELLDGAFIAPRTSSDIAERGRPGVIVGLSLFAPYGTDLLHTDQVEVDGVIYDIDGEPGPWKHPNTGWEAGIEVALKRAAG